jgi:carbonic anhydrase/acetyltransferase-like protein (isoleucine patch superfamily)
MVIPVNGLYPKLHSSVWLAPTATVIGDVEIGEKSSVWFNTVIRGDVFKIKIGRETNIQDNCMLHATYKKCGTTIGDRVTVGHQVILHGCEVKDGSLIGMGAIIMDNAVIGKNCLVGAGSLVTEESKFDDGMLIYGRPARAQRKLTESEIKHLSQSADNYMTYTGWYAGKEGQIP